MKKFSKIFIPVLATIILGGINYYLTLPALNLKSSSFYGFLIFLAVVFIVSSLLVRGFLTFTSARRTRNHIDIRIEDSKKATFKKAAKITAICIGAVFAVFLIIWISSSQLFRADKYQQLLTVNEANFSDDIAEIPLSQIPVVDRDTATRLGSRKIGEVVELVSQFNVSDYYTQINYNSVPTRVSPLEYADILKWFVNKDEGIPYYVKIDMASQDTELVNLSEGMKYSPSEYFSRDLMRHVRFKHPTKMFHAVSFEIDDNSHPYWVISYYDYTIGLLGGKDISGILLVDAVSGEITNYPVKDVPQWIDCVYNADLILQQADYWGKYKNGFFNSIFTQKNVIMTTDGYNYLAINDDVWVYTGITSVVADESNIGFLLVNLRTKEARTYTINGAEEYSAMSSAQGMIQEKGYTATFPILINIADTPSYFISLKDNAGLVKAYSFVSISNYQIVGVADTISGAEAEYRRLLAEAGKISSDEISSNTEAFTGTVAEISSAVVNSNTVYYIKFAESDEIFTADISVSKNLPFTKQGDSMSVTYAKDTLVITQIG